MTAPRRLLARLRAIMAGGAAPLPEMARLVSGELVTEVCSVYALRPGGILELAATHGLNAEAVGRTRLRVGEGIVGLCAATGQVINLADAQNHPSFAYRPETGEEPYASLLAVPVCRAGHTIGVLAVQNQAARHYDEDEVEVVETVAMLLAEILAASGVVETAEQGLAGTLPRRFTASMLASGFAIGKVALHGRHPAARRLLADDPGAEEERLHAAAALMQQDVDALIAARAPQFLDGGDGDASREVLEAYRLVAADTGWLRRAGAAIRAGLSAEAAVQRVGSELHDRMRRIKDPYLRERLADLEDMAERLLSILDGGAVAPDIAPGAILLARRLGPAELLDWHARGIGGVVIEEASASGHAAILGRALGLPMLGSARGVLDAAEEGDEAVLNADEGQLVLRPDAEIRQVFVRALAARAVQQADYAALRDKPTRTADGVPVRLMLNVGLALELDQLDATGAEGIGLFRTEIAMLAHGTVTDTAEQAAGYARVLDAAGDRPVMFRTLDLGGDKFLPGSERMEENPAMGWRSIRVGLDRPALLRRQLRALLLAAGGRPLSVMFPMIATVAEFSAARALLEAEARRMRPTPETLAVGAMLEVPSLLWQMPALLRAVDFLSIGSNDLLQFLFAADRGTPGLAARYDLLSAPVLDIMENLIGAAREAQVPISLCGEAAARPLEALTLVALGVTTLSMPAPSVLPIKAMLARADLGAFRRVLATIRRNGAEAGSLRKPIAAWAGEHGIGS
ncbi:MAG: GAF domain-containing protein [Acetobacteraceae bacterium]|nr:GAF domain-containing protein [Acetobacteraceae bacterium]